MTAPLCPNDLSHGPMRHVVIAHRAEVLGCAYFCTRDDEHQPDYCDGVRDCDCMDKEQVKQLEMKL